MKKLIAVFVLFTIITSCEEELNINIDPSTPSNVDKSLVLTAAQGSLATVIGGQLSNIGGFFAQYHTQAPSASQYLDIDTYNINTSLTNRIWNELYAGCLNDLNYVRDKSDEEGDTGTYLIATLLRVYSFQVLTDLYGDIPYSQALQGESNITPELDSGSDVYAGLLSEIDNAIAKYNSNPVQPTVGNQDAIYNSGIEDWIKFANTLKLKLYLRMAYTPQSNSTAVMSLLAEDNFITNDAMFSLYESAQNKSNPFYDVQMDYLGDVNNIASSSLLEFYVGNGDPRLEAVYRRTNGNTFRSIDQGDRDNYTSELASAFSRPNIVAETPVYLMTVSESKFLQAEALIRYDNGTGANLKYNEGIENSFLTYGLNASDAMALIGTGGAYEYSPQMDVESTLRQVMIQKWASLAYINNIEAFFESNRTKFPETVTSGNEDYVSGNMIVSISSILTGDQTPNTVFYPENEVDRNPNMTQKSSITEKIWWDQK